MFARQAAAALRVIAAQPAGGGRALEGERREDALQLLGSLERLLRGTG